MAARRRKRLKRVGAAALVRVRTVGMPRVRREWSAWVSGSGLTCSPLSETRSRAAPLAGAGVGGRRRRGAVCDILAGFRRLAGGAAARVRGQQWLCDVQSQQLGTRTGAIVPCTQWGGGSHACCRQVWSQSTDGSATCGACMQRRHVYASVDPKTRIHYAGAPRAARCHPATTRLPRGGPDSTRRVHGHPPRESSCC